MRLSRPLSLSVTSLARLKPYYGFVVKTLWFALSLFGLVMLAVSLPEYWRNLTTVCQLICREAQPTEPGLAMLARFGLGINFYAVVTLVAHLLVPLSIMTAMGVLIWHKPLNSVVIYLAFGGVAVSLVDGLLLFYAENHPWLTFPLKVLWVIAGIGISLGNFTFPDGKFVPSWGRYAAYTGAMASFLVFVPGDPQLSDSGRVLAMTALLLTAPVIFVCQVIRYFRTDSAKIKQQLKWILYTVGVSIAVIFMIFILHFYAPQSWTVAGAPGNLLSTLSINAITIAFWLCLAALVYFYNLFDINLVIKRTLVYGGLSAAIAVLYVLLVSGVSWLLKTPNQTMLMLMATLPVAFIARPLFVTLQHVTSRWFPVTEERLEPPLAALPKSYLIKTSWLALSLFGLVMLAVSLPETWRTLTTICQADCTRLQPTKLGLATLSRFGLGVEFYAVITFLTNLLVPLSVMTVMGLLLWRKPLHPVVVYLGFGGVAVSLATSLASYAENHPWFTFPMHVLWVVTGIGHYWGLLTFPDGKFVPSWNRYIAYFLAGASFLVFVPSITHLGNFGETPVNQSLWLVTLFTFVSLAIRYLRSSDAKTRQQIKWILYCIVVFVVVFVVHLILYAAAPKSWTVRGGPGDLLMMLAMNGLNILFYACLGTLVYFYNLFDINLVLKRTLIYGGLTLGIALLYVIFIAVAGILTLDYNNLFVSLLATGVIALAFQPLRERLQRGVNRLLYGYRDEPYKVLSQLGQRLESTSQSASILPATVQTIGETLKLPYAAIALEGGGTLASYGEAHGKQETFPLNYGGEILGELIVSPRQTEEGISKADRRLLNDLARQAGVAAHALLLQADLERSRLRVLSAREEARRRLGNDLHDSVGHQLTGLMRGAETASNLLERDPETAKKLLNELVQGSKGAIEHVRSLAHQLHPPELEVLGLADAIREKVQTFEHSSALHVVLEIDDLPKLPAAVEVAAYYIVQEALSNVLHHANATLCTIHLKMLNDLTLPTLTALATPILELEIKDNGCGLVNNKSNGLGLTSMCERATEVGGMCRIESPTKGGTRVLVQLPCSGV